VESARELLPGAAVRSLKLFRIGARRDLEVTVALADEAAVLRIRAGGPRLPVVLGQGIEGAQPLLGLRVAVAEDEVGELAPRVGEDRGAAAGVVP
jgi:hypothetical protein